jgi:hypothetical protein
MLFGSRREHKMFGTAKIILQIINFLLKRNYRGFELWLSSSILKKKNRRTVFWRLDLFPSGEGAGDTYSVGSVRKS